MHKIWSCEFDIRPLPFQGYGKGKDKSGKVIFFHNKQRAAFKNTIALMCCNSKWSDKKHIIDYPIYAEVFYYFKYSSALTKQLRNRMKDESIFVFPKTTRPDVTDNLNKGFIDALGKAGIMKDDSYVTEIRAVKSWAPKDMIVCEFYKIEVPEFLQEWCHGNKPKGKK